MTTEPGFVSERVFSNWVVISTSSISSLAVGISSVVVIADFSFFFFFSSLRSFLWPLLGSSLSFLDFFVTPEVSERFSFFELLSFFSLARRVEEASVGGFSLDMVGVGRWVGGN